MQSTYDDNTVKTEADFQSTESPDIEEIVPDSSADILQKLVDAEEAAVFKTFFSFLIEFFSEDNDTYKGAEKNAWTRAPQNIFILLQRFCLDNSLLTEFDFRTGTPSNLISNAKDFEKLRNRASRFLEEPVNANPKRFRELLDPNPGSREKERGKTRAIYELLSLALDKQKKQKDSPPTDAKKKTKEANLQIKNASAWQLRDFKTILQKWLDSCDQRIHDALHEFYETEIDASGSDKDGRIRHPLLRIFEYFELEEREDWITKKVKRVRLRNVEIIDLAVFFTVVLHLYEQD